MRFIAHGRKRTMEKFEGVGKSDKFPERLRRLRERRRMSRTALSECCGLSKNNIGRYERGEREPTASSLTAIADFFEVSVDYLVGRQDFM